MSVAHPAFVVVALAAIAGVHLFPRIERGRLLLVLSLVFVTTAVDMVSLVALGAFILIGFACVRFGTGMPGRLAMPAMVTAIVGVFWLLKAGGLPQQVSGNLPGLLGLSYVMFRILHLLVDVRERALPAPPGFASYVGYLLFFPNFLAGPIQRYEQFERQVVEPVPPLSRGVATAAGIRIATGFFKLVVLAGLAEHIFAASAETDGAAALAIAGLAFTVQLFLSFSGYMDVVTGLGRFLGVTISENFDRPFRAGNFLEFWSRWHITLSEWFKFYVFNPTLKTLLLADSRPEMAPIYAVLCFFLTFFLMGLWHGTTWPYVAYGVMLGFGVSINKMWQVWMTRRMGRKPYAALAKRPWYSSAARTLELGYFVIALTLIWMTAELAGRRSSIDFLLAAVMVLAAIALLVLIDVRLSRGSLASRVATSWKEVANSPWTVPVMLAAVAAYLGFSGRRVPVLIYQNF